MRQLHNARIILIMFMCLILSMAPTNVSHAVSIPFRGGDEDHYWDIVVVYCRDAVRIAANEIEHSPPVPPDFVMGDQLPFSLVLSRTATLLSIELPKKVATSTGLLPRELERATVAYTYATPQSPGTALNITLERWEHGEESSIETDPDSDFSAGDDVQVISGTVANCTAATQPQLDSPPTPTGEQRVNRSPGAPYSLVFQASDADAYDTVAIEATGLPIGATITPGLTGNPASATLNWTPGPTQIGIHTIIITAKDPTGRATAPYTVTVSVGTPIFLPLITH